MDERLVEMAPLYALGTLDGDDLDAFARSLPATPELQAEVAAFEAVLGRLAFLHATAAPAPAAVARVVWNPDTREAVLLAAGLQQAPEGKVYEAWVIAGGAPVPAGTFQADANGKAVLRLPMVDETRSVKTFAVTIEPAGGTAAPTGPMVLAGAV